MSLQRGQQILKTRDDQFPILLEPLNLDDPATRFRLQQDAKCSWASPGDAFGEDKLRGRVEPWLTALVQSEHLALLIGSGLTHAVHGIATSTSAPGMDRVTFPLFDQEINAFAERTARRAGRDTANFEDQIRVASELLRGLEVMQAGTTTSEGQSAEAAQLKEAIGTALMSFARGVLSAERNLIQAPAETRERAFNYLLSFLMSFASRTGTRERLQVFTTNYDRYIEAGADTAGLRLLDRFVGSLAPVFRSSRLEVDLHYNPPGMRGEPRYLEGVAHFTKLHGSVDWVEVEGAILRIGLPFGAADVSPYLAAPGLQGADSLGLMVYPNSAKDRETASHPYVELFRDFAASVCRPNSTLVTYGYSFGDEHINRVIHDMLTIPSAHLVVVSYGDPLGRVMRTYGDVGRPAQTTLLLGDHLGDLAALVNNYLPKPAIDRTTYRMAELLRTRWGVQEPSASRPQPNDGEN